MIFRLIAVIGLALAFQYAYQVYLFPTYEYASYRNVEMTLPHHFFTLALIAAPALLLRESGAPSVFGVTLIYVIVYIPGQIMLPRMLDDLFFPIFGIQALIAASMAAFCIVAGRGFVATAAPRALGQQTSHLVLALTIPCLAAMIATNYQHMRLVDFLDVYSLREDAAKSAQLPILSYTNLWLSYCFLPFFIAKGLLDREWLSLGLGFAGCLLIYLATGAKAQILLPFFMLGLYWVAKTVDLSFAKLAAFFAVLVLVFVLLPDTGPIGIAKSIFLMRTMSIGGLTMSLYYEFFSSFGFTNYTHISLVGPLIGQSPYAPLSLGQVIGAQYFGGIAANYNANFWASDGFAARGLMGIPIITAAICAMLYALDRLSSRYDPRFVSLWLTGFWLAMLNLPFSTAMLSGGGLLILLLLGFAQVQSFGSRDLSQSLKQAPPTPRKI